MPSITVNQIQDHFHKNQIYRRSKRYFDVIKLKSIEQNKSKLRRKPEISYSEYQNLEEQLKSSFVSSKDFYNKKRLKQIEKQKNKKYHSTNKNYDQGNQRKPKEIQSKITLITETNCSVRTNYQNKNQKNKDYKQIGLKGFDMNKSLSRSFYQNLENQSHANDKTFNEYVMSDFQKGQKAKVVDFNKLIGRNKIETIKCQLNPEEQQQRKINLGSKQENLNNLTQRTLLKQNQKGVNTSKIYQELCFDLSTFRCLFDVEKEKKAKQSKKNINKRQYQNDDSPKQLSLQKLQKGRNFTTKKLNKANVMFYHTRGMQQPSQIHYKTLKKNENYWLDQIKRIKQIDFSTVKRKQDEMEKRLDEIRRQKQAIDQRDGLCDQKFFHRLMEKERKIENRNKQNK